MTISIRKWTSCSFCVIFVSGQRFLSWQSWKDASLQKKCHVRWSLYWSDSGLDSTHLLSSHSSQSPCYSQAEIQNHRIKSISYGPWLTIFLLNDLFLLHIQRNLCFKSMSIQNNSLHWKYYRIPKKIVHCDRIAIIFDKSVHLYNHAFFPINDDLLRYAKRFVRKEKCMRW